MPKPYNNAPTRCRICGRTRPAYEFYARKDGDGGPITACKDCCAANLDLTRPETFMWVLEELDVPFVASRFYKTFDDKMRKDGPGYSRKAALGIYVRTITKLNMRQYGFKDSEELSARYGAPPEAMTRAEADAKLESGEISRGEYEAMEAAREAAASAGAAVRQEEARRAGQAADDELEGSLTAGDRQYLSNKWGSSYTAREWLKMEDLYTRYASEYDLNVDREETLRKVCKTSLKLDQALDDGDVSGYKALSQVLDSLRKSGKFTEAQNREDRSDTVGSVGQLVLLCEREGGIIGHLPPADEYPRDKIDLTINDYKQYAVSLLKNEPNISGIIEAYVSKLDEAQRKTDEFLSMGRVQPDPAVYEFGDDGVGGYGYPVGDDEPELSQDDADYIRALFIKDGLLPPEDGLDAEALADGRDESELYYL